MPCKLDVREAAIAVAGISSPAVGEAQDDAQFTVEAKFYQKLPNRKIKCKLCPRECTVGDKERGYCGVRENRGGSLLHAGPLAGVRGARRSR